MENDILQQILDELKEVKAEVVKIKTVQKSMDSRLTTMEEGQTRIEHKLGAVHDQVADLTEFRTDTTAKLNTIGENVTSISKDVNRVEIHTAENWRDIAILKAVK